MYLGKIKFGKILYHDNRIASSIFEVFSANDSCDKRAGMCKCEKVKESSFCYIGDGTSDLCIASKADVLFASKNLHTYCEKNNIKHSHFTSFQDIINVLKEGG